MSAKGITSGFAAAGRWLRLRLGIALAVAGIAVAAVYTLRAGPERADSPVAATPGGYRNVTPAITLSHISPVEYFRGLLGMTPGQRERALAGKPATDQKAILDKVKEYEAMPRDMREARLRQTDLQWRVITLMRMAPAKRVASLKTISPLDLPMIQTPLQQWDELPDTIRKALLENDKYLQTYVQWQVGSPSDQEELLKKLPESRRAFFTVESKRWQKVPSIRTLSPEEHRQMEEALQSFNDLGPDQRQRCVESFNRFVAMEPGERSQFLRNAEKWESMNPHERDLWRTMVGELPPMPPAPPGMPRMPLGMPPTPPGVWDATPTATGPPTPGR